jgi:AcrR family transcriptional regulator
MENGDRQPVQTRRRGEALENAIFAAALAELAERGYGGATMEGIAERAHTGKSALYRRWPNKQDLVLQALLNALPQVNGAAPDTGSLRGDLVQLLVRMTTVLDEPAGRVLRAVIVEGRHPELVTAIDEELIQPRIQLIVSALRRAADRGEISLASPVLLVSQVGPAMIVHRQLLGGGPMSEADVVEIVDRLIFPALGR